MWRIVILCWVFIAPTLAGILIMVTLFIPALAPDLGRWIIYAAITGAILAFPASFAFAKTQARGLP